MSVSIALRMEKVIKGIVKSDTWDKKGSKGKGSKGSKGKGKKVN